MSAHPAELRTLHLAMLDAVLVGSGLGAVASLAAAECGGPVALVVPRLELAAGSTGVGPADLGRLRGYALARCGGRVAPVPAGVVAEVPIASGEELLGVVLLLGDAPASADAVERLRLVAVAALTEIALARAPDAPDESASVTLLDALAGGADLSREEIVRRAARAGCDLRGGAVAVCCELHVDRPHHVAALVRDDWPGALAQHVTGDAGAPRLHALLPARPRLDPTALAERLARHGPVGLSPPCADPGELGRAMEAAALAIDLDPRAIGVAQSDAGALREHYEATLAPLVRYDGQYGTELVDTVERVLAGDVLAVAHDLGVPEHRVRYRLEKVRELTGLDATAAAGRRALGLGLRCFRVLGPALPA
jgi:GGDEF-like domain/PucR C-terminal helix-turn-helix domain